MQRMVLDLTNKRFGKLIAQSYNKGSRSKKSNWTCICDCGNITNVPTNSLTGGFTKSCGCLKFESNTILITHGAYIGGKPSSEMIAYRNMISRCKSDNKIYQEAYFNRGITICSRWLDSFENFLEDMGLKPSPIHTLDRENNDLGYSKENCRWATPTEQANNTRRNVHISWNGIIMTIAQWARFWNMDQDDFYRLLLKYRVINDLI